MLGGRGAGLMAAAIMISTFGCINGLVLAGARVYYAMAKDGLFFTSVGNVHPKYHTPAMSLMVQAVWAAVLTLTGSYNELLDYVIFAVVLFYILTPRASSGCGGPARKRRGPIGPGVTPSFRWCTSPSPRLWSWRC